MVGLEIACSYSAARHHWDFGLVIKSRVLSALQSPQVRFLKVFQQSCPSHSCLIACHRKNLDVRNRMGNTWGVTRVSQSSVPTHDRWVQVGACLYAPFPFRLSSFPDSLLACCLVYFYGFQFKSSKKKCKHLIPTERRDGRLVLWSMVSI